MRKKKDLQPQEWSTFHLVKTLSQNGHRQPSESSCLVSLCLRTSPLLVKICPQRSQPYLFCFLEGRAGGGKVFVSVPECLSCFKTADATAVSSSSSSSGIVCAGHSAEDFWPYVQFSCREGWPAVLLPRVTSSWRWWGESRLYESLAQGGLGIGLSSVVSCRGAGSLMIRNSVKGFLFFFRRIRGGNDSESFRDSVVDSHAVGLRGNDSGWALMDMDRRGRGGERTKWKEPELDYVWKVVFGFEMFLRGHDVVGMSERESCVRFVGTAPLVSL